MDVILNARAGWGFRYSLCNIDLESFGEWADYCDETIGVVDGTDETIFRWRIGLAIDQQRPFMDALQQIASCGRAQIIRVGDVFKAKVDKAASPVQLFTMGNIVRDSFQMQWASTKDRSNVIDVQFLNAEKNYDHDLAPLYDEDALSAGELNREESISLFGLTSRTRAYRACQYYLNVNRLLKRTIQFRAGIDAVIAEAGDVISFQHERPNWSSVGGRLDADAPSSTSIILPRDIVVGSGETWKVVVRTTGASGSTADVIQERQLIVSAGTITAGTTISITEAWATGDEPNDLDPFAVGPVQTDSPTTLWKVISSTLTQDLERKIQALEYNALVYDDDPGTIEDEEPDEPIDESTIPPNPTALILQEQVTQNEDGSVTPKLFVSFTKEPWPFDYTVKVFLREDGDAVWLEEGETSTSYALIDNLESGITYCVSVVSVSPTGNYRAPSTGQIDCITLQGKADPPSDASNVVAVQSDEELLITWDAISEPLRYYEVRYGYAWTTGKILGQPTTNSLETTKWAVGSQTIFVRGYSVAERYSAGTAEDEVTLSAPDSHTSATTRDEESLSWPGTSSNLTTDTEDGLTTLILDTAQTSGSYTSPSIDIGALASHRIGLLVLSNYDEITRTWDSGTEDWDAATYTWDSDSALASWDDSSLSWDDVEADEISWWGDFYSPNGSLAVETRYSDDDVSFSAWQEHTPTTRTTRYVQFRLTLTRTNATDYQVRVRNALTSYSDPA